MKLKLQGIEFGPLVRTDTGWDLYMDGVPVEMTTQQLTNYSYVRKRAAEKINKSMYPFQKRTALTESLDVRAIPSHKIWVDEYVKPLITGSRSPLSELHELFIKMPDWFTLIQLRAKLWEIGETDLFYSSDPKLAQLIRGLGGYKQNRGGKAVWRILL